MNLHAVILRLLLALPATATPEAEADRVSRMETIATALDSVTQDPGQAAAVITAIWFESHLDPLIHAGLRHPRWHSDRGRARCLSQVHKSPLVKEWDHMVGTDIESTTNCLRATLRLLKSASWVCGNRGVFDSATVARTYMAYGTGRCQAPMHWATVRAEFWARTRARLDAGR